MVILLNIYKGGKKMSEQTFTLGKDETIVSKNILSFSLILFFIKSSFEITNKRLVGQIPNLIWIFPMGKNMVTYPLKNISGVRIDNKFSLKRFIIGIILILIGLSKLSSLFIVFLIGIFVFISGFEVFFVIQNTAGATMKYAVSPLEKAKAQQLINELNQIIVDNV